MSREYRTIRNAGIRAIDATDGGAPGVTLQAITPNIVDDYGSVFTPDCFDRSIEERGPVLCWAHNWADPIGHPVGYETGDGGPRVSFEYDDFDAVPRAKQANSQVRSGTIRDCSVGFSNTKRRDPTDDELAQWPGVREVIFEADLDEISLVLRGAVPGAQVVAYRGAGQRAVTVPIDAVTELARKVNAGEITEDEAHTALELLSVDDGDGQGEEGGEGEPSGDDGAAADEALDTLEADADAALASSAAVTGRSRRRGARR